jgi:hypothetical protein
MIILKLLLGIPLIVLGIKDLKVGINYLYDEEPNSIKKTRTLWVGFLQVLLGIMLILVNWNSLK